MCLVSAVSVCAYAHMHCVSACPYQNFGEPLHTLPQRQTAVRDTCQATSPSTPTHASLRHGVFVQLQYKDTHALTTIHVYYDQPIHSYSVVTRIEIKKGTFKYVWNIFQRYKQNSHTTMMATVQLCIINSVKYEQYVIHYSTVKLH